MIISKASIESGWVEWEVDRALEEEERRNQDRAEDEWEPVLFPVMIDGDVLNSDEKWAWEIKKRRHIGDLVGWERDDKKYAAGFERLLRDLKGEKSL